MTEGESRRRPRTGFVAWLRALLGGKGPDAGRTRREPVRPDPAPSSTSEPTARGRRARSAKQEKKAPQDPWRKYSDALESLGEKAWGANDLLLRRARRLIVEAGSGGAAPELLATFLKNLSALGYGAAPALIERLQALSDAELTTLYNAVIKSLRKALGDDHEFEPMYPNFPEQVMEADEAELYINASLHYLGDSIDARIMPDYEKESRAPLEETTALTVIDLGSEADLLEMGQRLIGARTSISEQDRWDVAWFVRRYWEDVATLLPEEIPYKENLAFVTALLLDHPAGADTLVTSHVRTPTDVLRLAVALSGGDVSLAEAAPLRSFPRRHRRALLGLLEQCRSPHEEMQRRAERWKRLGERLHPGEYRARFPQSAEAFDRIRKGEKGPPGFHARVEAAVAAGDASSALDLLQRRPGELARRLDHLLRLTTVPEPVLEAFGRVAADVAVPVLLQVLAHFEHRPVLGETRAFFPKGNAARVVSIPNELPALDPTICQRVVAACREALIARFAERPALGATYIDPALSEFVVPFSQRSASRSLRTLVRGSRIPLPEGDTIRFFLWWKEGYTDAGHTGRVDIDLSAVFFDALWKFGGHVSYTNLRSEKFRSVHSGDITSAPEGACEFIDLDIPSFTRNGGRYVVMSVLSFSAQPFYALPECFGGLMVRESPGSGEVFEPSTVSDRIDLSGDKRICVPCILDLVQRKMIWADIQLTRNPSWYTNVEANRGSIAAACRAITTLAKPTLHDLLSLHAEARGRIVDTPEEAETEFSVAKETPFAVEEIMADYL